MNRTLLGIGIAGLLAIMGSATTHADKVCVRFNSKKKTIEKKNVTTGNCPKKFLTLVDTATLTGPAGSNGSTGADGKLAVWGDGSDGDITVPDASYLDYTKQYQNITIPGGAFVFIRSGHTIRCTGTFTLAGTLFNNGGDSGGFVRAISASQYQTPSIPASKGLASAAAGLGQCTSTGTTGVQGNPGAGFGLSYPLRIPELASAGSGAGAPFAYGGSGGGTVSINCKQGITVSATGSIYADGQSGNNGSGGGGGGIVILASNGPIAQAGLISVKGGDGGPSSSRSCRGGGGGGGFIHFISRSVSNTGTNTVTGGSAGVDATTPSDSPRCGGAGGGASYGNGGSGGTVDTGNFCTSITSSQDGAVVTTTPTGGSVESLLL